MKKLLILALLAALGAVAALALALLRAQGRLLLRVDALEARRADPVPATGQRGQIWLAASTWGCYDGRHERRAGQILGFSNAHPDQR